LMLEYEELLICFTHSSLTNEYEVIDNAAFRTIGADVEKLYLVIKYFNRLKSITNINVISVVGFIQGQQEFYKSFFEKKNISHLILASKSWESAKNSSYSAYVDTFRAVLFILFYN